MCVSLMKVYSKQRSIDLVSKAAFFPLYAFHEGENYIRCEVEASERRKNLIKILFYTNHKQNVAVAEC